MLPKKTKLNFPRRIVFLPFTICLLFGFSPIFWGALQGCSAPHKEQVARINGSFFEILQDGQWKPFFLKGVNVSLALPGQRPGAFPAGVEDYRKAFRMLADMNCNTIRIYTLQPPLFYKELAAHNRKNPKKILWLMQGVWLDEPPKHNEDYLTAFNSNGKFQKEIEWVISAVHGDMVVPARPGWAYGSYTVDVSHWTVGFLLGREMEPYIVEATDLKHAKETSFQGKYFTLAKGTPTEVWAVKMLEHTIAYEQETYGVQRPVAMSNWPTLDPIDHHTEPRPPYSSEDVVPFDLGSVKNTSLNKGGMFISYHVYPYYPNFINLDERYRDYKDHIGPNPYEGYLKLLKRHYKDLPLVAGEYGLPASMAAVHLAASGMDHGMQDEIQQAKGVRRLTDNIIRTGWAGALVFAWIDEWFKRTWSLDPFQERESIPRWHNKLSPEEHFGLLALEVNEKGQTIILGDPKSWNPKRLLERTAKDHPPYHDGDSFAKMRRLKGLRVQHDPGFLYLQIEVEDLDPDKNGKVDWSKAHYIISLDTYDTKRGESKIHAKVPVKLEQRIEFRIQIKGKEDNTPVATVEVAQPYDLYGIWHSVREPSQIYRSVKSDTGLFNVQKWIMEMELHNPLKPKEVLQKRQNFMLGLLKYGHKVEGKKGYDPMSQYYGNIYSNTIALRIPWSLIHYSDPSRRHVFHDNPLSPSFDHRASKGIRFTVSSLRPGNQKDQPPTLMDILPGGPAPDKKETIIKSSPLYTWPHWENPSFKERIRPVYYELKEKFAEIP